MAADKVVILIHVPTEDQRADILTQTVYGVVFKSHVENLLSTQFDRRVWFSAVEIRSISLAYIASYIPVITFPMSC